MTKKLRTPVSVIVTLLLLLPMIVGAQSAPIQSGMGNEDTGAPKLSLDEPLPGEKIIDKLKLDGKTQAPEARLVFMDASREAAPVGQKMLELRQRLINGSGFGNLVALMLQQHLPDGELILVILHQQYAGHQSNCMLAMTREGRA